MLQRWIVLMCLVLGLSVSLLRCGTPPSSQENSQETQPGETLAEGSKEPVSEPAKEPSVSPEPGKEPASESASEPLFTPDEPVSVDDGGQEPVPEPVGEPTPEPAPELAPEPTPETSTGNDVDRAWLSKVTCKTQAPAGATLAASPPKYTGGACPKLKPGRNAIKSKGSKREFLLVMPSNPKPGEVYPVLFLWHWLKGRASKFLSQGEVQSAVDQQRFIAVIPESKKDIKVFGVLELPWPFTTFASQSRLEEEFVFFDDMLSCVSQQYKVNKECVSSVGVSAGALFTVQLAAGRSQYLSSFISLSGGSGGGGLSNQMVRSWKSPPHKMPALVLWGGPVDSCILLNFQQASQALEKLLQQGGHFFVECIHNCKHGEPPIAPPAGVSKYAPIWEFFLQHPFWLKPGQSPLQVNGWPNAPISWCGIGAGSATPRTGSCPSQPGCPID